MGHGPFIWVPVPSPNFGPTLSFCFANEFFLLLSFILCVSFFLTMSIYYIYPLQQPRIALAAFTMHTIKKERKKNHKKKSRYSDQILEIPLLTPQDNTKSPTSPKATPLIRKQCTTVVVIAQT
jgi:hypothetical protein